MGAFTHEPGFVSIDFCAFATPAAVSSVSLPALKLGSWSPAYASTKVAFDAETGHLFVYTYTEYPQGQYGADYIVAVDSKTGSLVFNTSLPALGATDSCIALGGPTGGHRRLYVNLNGDPNKGEAHVLLTLDPVTGSTLHRQIVAAHYGYFQALFSPRDTTGSLLALGPGAVAAGWHLRSFRISPNDGTVSPLSDLMVDASFPVSCSGLNVTSDSASILQHVNSQLGYAARFVGISLESGAVEYSSTEVAGGVFDGAADDCALIAW
jgi:hypothetical protein